MYYYKYKGSVTCSTMLPIRNIEKYTLITKEEYDKILEEERKKAEEEAAAAAQDKEAK